MTFASPRRLSLFAALLGFITLPFTALAQPANSIDPKADAVLRQMSRTLAGAKSLSFESTQTTDETAENGQRIQLGKQVHVKMRRPDRLAATVRGDADDLTYTYDGKTLTIVNTRDHAHAVQDVPNTIDAMFDFMAERYGIVAPLSDVLFTDPYQALIGQIRSGGYVGLHEVSGVKCHHLAFRQDEVDWQIWIEDGAQSVPRKIVITHKNLPGYPQFIAVLDKWNLSPTIADTDFQAKVPQDSKRVDLPSTANTATPSTQPSGAGRAGGDK